MDFFRESRGFSFEQVFKYMQQSFSAMDAKKLLPYDELYKFFHENSK